MKTIIATHHRVGSREVTYSDEDYDKVSKQRWYLRIDKDGKVTNVIARVIVNGERRVMTMAGYILETHTDKTVKVHYIDGNCLNNQRSNLFITHYNNVVKYDDARYGIKMRPGTSRFRGVCLNKTGTRYIPMVKYKGRKVNLGTFPATAFGEMDAAIARDIKVLELFGDRAVLNFPIETLRTHFAKRINEKFITGSDDAGWSVDIPITERTTKHIGEYDTLPAAIEARNEYIAEWGGEEALCRILEQ